MCASGKRFRPITCNINHGLNASAMSCAHKLGDFSLGLSSFRKHRFRMHASVKRCNLPNGDYNQGLHYVMYTSTLACAHQISYIGWVLHTSVRWHQSNGLKDPSRHEHISSVFCESTRWHLFKHASIRWCRPTIGKKRQSIHTSNVVIEHVASVIRQLNAPLFKVCTNNPWRVSVGWVPLT